MGHGGRDDDDIRRRGMQWRQGLLGGLATLLGILAGSIASRSTDAWWIASAVAVGVVVLVMVAGRPLLPRR